MPRELLTEFIRFLALKILLLRPPPHRVWSNLNMPWSNLMVTTVECSSSVTPNASSMPYWRMMRLTFWLLTSVNLNKNTWMKRDRNGRIGFLCWLEGDMEIAGKAWKLVMFRCDKLMITSGQKETPGMEKWRKDSGPPLRISSSLTTILVRDWSAYHFVADKFDWQIPCFAIVKKRNLKY